MLKNTNEDKLIKLDDESYVEAEYVFLHPSMPKPQNGYNAYCAAFLAKDYDTAARKEFFKDVCVGWFFVEKTDNLLDKAHEAAIQKWPQLEVCESPEIEEENEPEASPE